MFQGTTQNDLEGFKSNKESTMSALKGMFLYLYHAVIKVS